MRPFGGTICIVAVVSAPALPPARGMFCVPLGNGYSPRACWFLLCFSPMSRMSRGPAAQPVLALWFARLWRLLQCVFGPRICTTEHIAAGTRNAFAYWSHGVTVSTLDPESSDRGSNPRETLSFCAKPSALAAWAADLHLRWCPKKRATPLRGVRICRVGRGPRAAFDSRSAHRWRSPLLLTALAGFGA